VSVTVIPTNNAYSYDLNGNLLSDGTRNFSYDDENELIAVWQANAWSNNFVYDGKMRRRIERDYIWNTGTSNWLQTNEVHFIYDGNLAVQERNASNLPQVSYTRGNDLSGSFQGAGGIGGLLARTDNAKLMVGDSMASAYYHSDGNGNVTCLINAFQQLAAKYLYDTYGNTLATYGSLATANRYRFSSKEWNENSGLYYYLYRFYDPNLQRWLNRDPIQEIGGLNLYCFVLNRMGNGNDPFGLKMDASACGALLRKLANAWQAADDAAKAGTWDAGILKDEAERLQASYNRNCEDPPPPSDPWWCPANRPVFPNPGNNYLNPNQNNSGWFCSQHPWICAGGIAIGVGIGVAVCIAQPELCAIGIILAPK
jgi:RHS repeat-associated protein